MPGPPPSDPSKRRRRNAPERGDWTHAPGVGWQHGDPPAAPDGLLAESREAWSTWLGAWYAAFWGPGDVPALRLMVQLHDQVHRGDFARAPELRAAYNAYGITPKGQQDRRWAPPLDPEPRQQRKKPASRARLKAVK